MKSKLYTTIRVATRPSLLATTQTSQTVALLKAKNPEINFEIITFSTHGDRVTDKPLVEFGGTGLFVKELEQALIEGKADIAVHSLKDMPSEQPEQLVVAAYAPREDARDVILTKDNKGLASLHPSMIIGTGSPRRQLQLLTKCNDIQFKNLRGNIDTRLRKLNDGEYDAIVLAAAGLHRLGKSIDQKAYIPVFDCIPAVGQGAIALECRAGDKEILSILKSINHTDTEIAVTAERAFMRTIGGGCKFPLAAHATIKDDKVFLDCIIGDVATCKYVRLQDTAIISENEQLGINLGNSMRQACLGKGIKV